jgi:ABC-2 type transporter
MLSWAQSAEPLVFRDPPSSDRFFTFWGTLLVLQIYSSSLFRFIGATVRAIVFGTAVGVLVMLVTMLACGFVIVRPQIPDWWDWTFWVSPLQYTITALANNEYSGESYQTTTYSGGLEPGKPLGDVVLDQFGFLKGRKWRCAIPVGFLAAFVGTYSSPQGHHAVCPQTNVPCRRD